MAESIWATASYLPSIIKVTRRRRFRISLQAGGDTYSRRCRRMGNYVGQHRERQPARNYQGDALSAFARAALFGIHPLRGIQGQFGRIQVDGPGALRLATLSRSDPRQSDRFES